MNLYEVLGVDQQATPEEIKRAYRKKASRHHPDREGGDTETFQRVQKAYDTLSDPDKRSQYDLTGESDPQAPASHLTLLFEIFQQVVSSVDVRHTDIVSKIRQVLENGQRQLRKEVAELVGASLKWKTVGRRLKPGQSGLVPQMCLQQRRSVIGSYLRIRQQRKAVTLCLDELVDWEYQVDPQPPRERAGISDHDLYRMMCEISGVRGRI